MGLNLLLETTCPDDNLTNRRPEAYGEIAFGLRNQTGGVTRVLSRHLENTFREELDFGAIEGVTEVAQTHYQMTKYHALFWRNGSVGWRYRTPTLRT